MNTRIGVGTFLGWLAGFLDTPISFRIFTGTWDVLGPYHLAYSIFLGFVGAFFAWALFTRSSLLLHKTPLIETTDPYEVETRWQADNLECEGGKR